MNIMPFYLFNWNSDRLEKLAVNGVDADEFETIGMNPDSRAVSRSSGRPIAFGTDSRGEEIACVYEIDEDDLTASPVTAYCTRE